MDKIAKNIRERRQEMGMSQGELAMHLGVSKSTVSNYERGVTDPCPRVMGKLSSVLDVPISYFFVHSPEAGELPPEVFMGGLDTVIRASVDGSDVMMHFIRNGKSMCAVYSMYENMYFRVSVEKDGQHSYMLMQRTEKLPEGEDTIYACLDGMDAEVYSYARYDGMHVLRTEERQYNIKDINKVRVLGVLCEPEWD